MSVASVPLPTTVRQSSAAKLGYDGGMCGRYALLTSTPEIARILGLDGEWETLVPRYNVAPTQQMPVARAAKDGTIELLPMRWGLVPFWAKDTKIGNKLINARSETAAEKPSFRAALRQRRCLIPADGYFEWCKQASGDKQPYYIRSSQNSPLFFAGLWEQWRNSEDATVLLSYTILTTAAGASLEAYHHRMPVMIETGQREPWLRLPPENKRDIDALLAQQIDHSQGLEFLVNPVSKAVNSPRNDDERCIQATA